MNRFSSSLALRVIWEGFVVLAVKGAGDWELPFGADLDVALTFLVKKLEMDCCFLAEDWVTLGAMTAIQGGAWVMMCKLLG